MPSQQSLFGTFWFNSGELCIVKLIYTCILDVLNFRTEITQNDKIACFVSGAEDISKSTQFYRYALPICWCLQ